MHRPGHRSFLVLAALLMLCPPRADAAETVVYPTGNPANDVARVRAAVQTGGTVLLKARDTAGIPRAFEFGDYAVGGIDWDSGGYVALGTSGEVIEVTSGAFRFYVSLGNDVRLVGETRALL